MAASFRGLTPDQSIDLYSLPEPNSGCWLWLAGSSAGGYGKMNIGNKQHYAHRVSFEITKGKLQTGMCVRHTCDTPACVNPDHLISGTQADNVQDMRRRGRARYRWSGNLPPLIYGRNHVNAKLTDDIVISIRKRKSLPVSLAKELGVSYSTLKGAYSGKTWRHVR